MVKNKMIDWLDLESLAIILFVVFLVGIASASSAYAQTIRGGETINFSISKCENIDVNITGAIFGEWTAAPNCTEIHSGKFECNCTDGWTLGLTPAINSVGNFNITIVNYYQGEAKTEISSYHSYYTPPSCKAESRTCSGMSLCCDGLECVNNICRTVQTTTTTTIPTTTTTTETTTTTTLPPNEGETPKNDDGIILIAGALILFVSIVAGIKYKAKSREGVFENQGIDTC